ncbi:hypothetical protein BDR07DRAFT_1378418 [Suillus spraguei]|nr:hypothetical protein BDR07DRAFT_1378418 [Suillus spraguei]
MSHQYTRTEQFPNVWHSLNNNASIFSRLQYQGIINSLMQMVGLLECGISIWPMQLPQYAEAVMLMDDEIEDTLIPMKEIYYESSSVTFVFAFAPMIGDWQELVHPLGGTYYYNNIKNAYTSMNIGHYQNLQRLNDFIDPPQKKMNHQIITWLEDMDGHILFGECVNPSKRRHKRLELEAQYCETHKKRNWLLSWRQAPYQSTTTSMFWTLDQMNQVVAQLASISRILYILCHYQYLHRHNQPEARLIRTHVVRERRRKNKLFSFIGNAIAMVLCVPVTIERIQTTSVDGIVNGVEVRQFINDFSSQAKSQITLAGVSMALDVAILAVPGLGTSEITQILCRLYFCGKYGATLLRENGIPRFCSWIHSTFLQSDSDIINQAYYLHKKRTVLVIITTIPTFFAY